LPYAGDGLQGVAQFRLNADGALEQGEDGLEVGVVAIDAVVELAALGFSAEQAFAGQAGELAETLVESAASATASWRT